MTPVDQEASRDLALRREYPDPVEAVWAAFTESERLARWFGSYTGTGRPGGTVELTITGEADAGGETGEPTTVTILECAAPHRLVVEMPETPERTWRIAVTLTGSGTGTSVLFEQHVAEGLDVAEVAAGWNWYLDRLAASMHGTAMPDWTDYAP